MEHNSSWSHFFIEKNGSKRLSPIATAFIIAQIVLFIVIIATVIWINTDKVPDNDVTRYEKIPELTIKDLSQKASILTERDIKDIQKKVFQIVSENTKSIDIDKVELVIRNGETHAQTFRNNSKYVSMIVDIPSLEQSYQVFYSTNAVIDPNISTFVLCLDDSIKKVYPDFKCKSSDDESIKHTIVSSYLRYFSFEYFSAYIKPDDPKTIIISPSVTYNNSEETKAKYVEEVKESIKSLGLRPDVYEYYVRTAKDVNYRN